MVYWMFRALLFYLTVIFLLLILSPAGRSQVVAPFYPTEADDLLPKHRNPADAVLLSFHRSGPHPMDFSMTSSPVEVSEDGSYYFNRGSAFLLIIVSRMALMFM